MNWHFDNSFARDLERFRVPWQAENFPDPSLMLINRNLAGELGLDLANLAERDIARIFTGQIVPDGAEPVAMAYSAHQFGQFSPILGDGRALLLGEVITPGEARFDIHLKGSGPTPFSRGGDGKCALGPALREYLMSEAMHALGIPTTRALAVTLTGENILRQKGAEPGAVLARVAASHIRIGTFQFAAAHLGIEEVRRLADYTIARHYPTLSARPNPYLTLLDAVIGAQAELVAQWMLAGFVHGVMNTDNVSIVGETIDYGPCAFLDTYSAHTVFSSIDTQGRYAFGNQPSICRWNLARLAEALGGVIVETDPAAKDAIIMLINGFSDRYHAAWLVGMRVKLGLADEHEGDLQLATDLFSGLERAKVDFTRFFRELAQSLTDGNDRLLALFEHVEVIEPWLTRWRDRIAAEPLNGSQRAQGMNAVNPLYIPRNHKVEEALNAAVTGDMALFEHLLEVVTHPFTEHNDWEDYARPAPLEAPPHVTYCGT